MIVLTGNPLSTQNAYLQHGKIRFMKKEAKERKEQYQWEARSQWKGFPLKTELGIRIRLYFGDKRRRDWDNFHKLSMDALTGIVWEDDSQIREAHITLHYDKQKPRIEIEIYESSQRP